ncbi:unnamed protein product [Rotaria magnacalcarata]|uniref:Uncharacterized protein n=3 Tax=Rotaria magnacalcarata TaxID=392030 RepID=A0A815WKL1_9BILA|nr:unnamed protein product [Rotaria magnacalcarata]
MSSLPILLFYIILTGRIIDNTNIYFTQSIYDIWCQENILSNSLVLYPNRIRAGIYHTSNIKSVVYNLIDDDDNNSLFSIKTKRLVDFYFFILNITRPFDINREYQNLYVLHLQATIITIDGNSTEQAKIHLHVADSNDNDAVFDMDAYEQNFTEPIEIQQSLIRFHASDADEIQHAQILYELSSSFNDTFSLHPYTGELYLVSNNDNLQSIYEFYIHAYDRHRKYFVNNNIKTKAHVKLIFQENNKTLQRIQTIFNQIVEFKDVISTYKILFKKNTNWNYHNIHQPILIIQTLPQIEFFEIFLLLNSSSNSIELFFRQNKIYLNKFYSQEYNLQFLICFFNRTQCQYANYDLTYSIDWNLFQFDVKTIQPIVIEENLPQNSFLTYIQLQYNHIIPEEQLIVNYQLLNNHIQFNLDPKTSILRLGKYLKCQIYILDIQVDIYLSNESYSVKTTIEINVNEINKHRPQFHNQTLIELNELPYKFQAFDLDENKQTNGRITYCLGNCFTDCPFEINPNNGVLQLRKQEKFNKAQVYNLQIIAFDWGEPISLETKIDIHIDLSSRLVRRDLTGKLSDTSLWTNQSISILPEQSYPANTKIIYLNIGFNRNSTFYHLAEDAEINTIIDRLLIEHDSFPLFINNEKDNLFFYTINDTSAPFTIDQNEKTIKLTMPIDREKQDRYTFEIELKLKPTYAMKLQDINSSLKGNSLFRFQYSNKYYQKILVTIYINDVNDNIPRCDEFHKHIYLNENQIQTNIFHVQAIDPDQGDSGTIVYSLLDNNQYFTINSHTGQIDLIQQIDREEKPFLQLYIIASDQGQQLQLQSICMTLHITIADMNDNIPRFLLANYTYQLFSDLPRDTIFGQIHAIDFDSTNNLIYSIDPNPYVKIDQYTGHLRLKHNVYHMIDQTINITAQVSDGLHVNYTEIYIYIIRVTEAQEPILLREPAYEIVINRSLPIGTIITNVYHDLRLLESSVDFIDIIHDDHTIPFGIDQQGSIRLIHSSADLSNATYWLSIRLTRYRARPPHSFVHVHISVREDDFYSPQCVDIYRNVKIYDYSIPSIFARVSALSFYDDIQFQYSIVNDSTNKNMFSIDKKTGSIQLNPTNHLTLSNYKLTIEALDRQHQLSVDCYLEVNLIRRNQLTPKFFYSPIYYIDLIETSLNSQRLRQRLFQVIALLDHKVYDKNIEVRYQIMDSNQYFIINRQSGYIASKQILEPKKIYEFSVEAFTVAYRDDVEHDETIFSESSIRGKWRVVSSRIILPIKIRVLPANVFDRSLSFTGDSTIDINLLTTTKVGSTLVQLQINSNRTQWFIMIGHIDHTHYFHVNFQSGELILIRPVEELMNGTTKIELNINTTHDWIHMTTIKVMVHIIDDRHPLISFSQADYYTTVSRTIPIGSRITELTIENLLDNCTYHIHSAERIKSKNLFRIDPNSGSITNIQPLGKSMSQKHLLTIIHRCESLSQIAYARLHINIVDEETPKNQTDYSYRFSQDNYLVIFETSLIKNQKKYLIDLELISNDHDEQRIKPDAQIIEGDPLGLFSIDSSNQSILLLDESRSRSYTYPIELVIIDVSQIKPIFCIVTIFISNIGLQFTCPLDANASPNLFTYKSIPPNSIDPLTGQKYHHYDSLIIHGLDTFTPSHVAKCLIDFEIKYSNETIEFVFEKEFYDGYVNNLFDSKSFVYSNQEPIQLSIKNRNQYTDSFNITYQLIYQTNIKSFELDQSVGRIKYIQNKNSFIKYSLLILARYQSLIASTRLNVFIQDSKQLNYKFILYKPFVNNYTIGYLNALGTNFRIFNKKLSLMFSIDHTGRLFVRNQALILTNGNFYTFLIGKARVQINILSKEIIHCSLNRFNLPNDDQLIGFVQILNANKNHSRKKSCYLLNYNHLFLLEREHGLLRYRGQKQLIMNDLILLIEIENSRCLVTFNGFSSIPYMMIRKGSNLDREIEKLTDFKKQSGLVQLRNGYLINFDIISRKAPLFSQKSYTFSLDITNNTNKTIFIGQISAQPYNINRSRLVYQFVSPVKHFIINPDNGIIEYMSNNYNDNKTIVEYQIIARDLIYQQNTTINITIHILKPEFISLTSLIYFLKISEILPPGSVIFQPNISNAENLQYSLHGSNSDLFTIDSNTGQVTLINYLSDQFYSFKIHISPINKILIIKLTVLDYNNHRPIFSNFPLNLTISSEDIFVTKLSAYDLDASDNENLKFYLLDKNQRNFFSINEKTGIITQNSSSNQTFIRLEIAVSDGLYLTKTHLSITIRYYSKHRPTFSSDEYAFEYNKILGQILAHDSDPDDQIVYKLYLEPDGVTIDPYSGLIMIHRDVFPRTIEFFASASDYAQQIVYTKIRIIFPIQPQFTSNLYFISLTPPMKIPYEIFHLQLVNSLNQPLSFTRFRIDQTSFIEITQNKLMLKRQLMLSKIYHFNIYGYWKNYTCQTSIQIRMATKNFSLNKKSYEFSMEKTILKENSFIEKFDTKKNSTLIINSTPLTRSSCIENFYIKQNKLFFKNFPILSDLCFFEIQLIYENSISSSQIKASFIDSNIKPKFSSNIYYFHTNNIRVFATSFNEIRYRLQTNPFGFIIDPTNGILSFKYDFNRMKTFHSIQLFVYAIDEKTLLNDTAIVHIIFNKANQQFSIPREIPSCQNTSILISDQTLPGTIIQNIQLNNNNSTYYYILSGDKYGLFAINNLGELSLASAILNQTCDDYFELIILISSLSKSYCRTNISIIRSPNWSYFICPIMPIEWMIEEESPIDTEIGSIKDVLLMINNNSHLVELINMQLIGNSDTQLFHFNSSTGLLTSKSRLDYEQKHIYSFFITLEPNQLHCSFPIVIKLININDNAIKLDSKSLIYNLNENNLIPFYIGRIKLIDIDQLFLFEYKFYLRNFSSQISIDATTGSIILLDKLDREIHGEKLQYDIIAIDRTNQKTLADKFTISINDLNDHGPVFEKDLYQISINKSTQPGTIIFQVMAFSYDPIMNGNISYYLMSSSFMFSIDKHTGDIRLNEYIPSAMASVTLTIQAREDGIDLVDRTDVFITIINDDYIYFTLENRNRCFIDENQPNGTKVCTIGKDSIDFIYDLMDPTNTFGILSNNGTIINRKIFDYEIDKHEYNVSIIVKDRMNQSIFITSTNLTIHVRNLNDNSPEFLTENFTRLLYLFYPSLNTILYKIDFIDKDQSNLTYEIINDISSTYTLRTYADSIELLLDKPILNNRQDNLIIRIWDEKIFFSDLNLSIIYLQDEIDFPTITSQTIQGYINFEENFLPINLGELFIENHAQYEYIHFNLIADRNFFLTQLSNNQTELYFKPLHQTSSIEYRIRLTVMAIPKPIPGLVLQNNTQIFFPSNIQFQTINIQLRSIYREMLDRTISLLINIPSNLTYEQFIIHNLSSIRQHLAEIVDVNIDHVHIYTYELKQNQIELLVSILHSISKHYIHKKVLYNQLKSSTNIFEKILLNQCDINSCENNAHCTSYISLLYNQYEYFHSNTYQNLIPKYQWNIKCLCMNSFYGERCEFKYDKQSPCSSNPCSLMERCIEESSTLYSCQCVDELCNDNIILDDNSFECINVNSPTCRDASNALTFNGHSLVRINFTMNMPLHIEVAFSFRTQSTEGKLLELMYFNETKTTYGLIIIQIIDGYLNVDYNENILLQLNQLLINDGLWHDIYFSIDYSHYYYLIRLDHVFSDKILLSQHIHSNNLVQLMIGSDFKGCVDNITFNHEMIFLEQENDSIEFIGTNKGCLLTEVARKYSKTNDICSLYHPCYHGGICTDHGLSFTCNCSQPRFAGDQCQLDLYPCQSHPCRYHEQCIPLLTDSNRLFTCVLSIVPLSISIKRYLYIVFIAPLFMCILSVLVICRRRKRKDNSIKTKPLVSAPLLVNKRSSSTDPIEKSTQASLKLNYNGRQTFETMSYGDNNSHRNLIMNYLNNRNNQQAYQSLNRRSYDSKSYSTSDQMTVPSDEPLTNDSATDYDNAYVPQAKELFDYSLSPTNYFNAQNADNQINYQVRLNSLSNLTENFAEEYYLNLTESSDASNNNDRILLSSLNANRDHEYSCLLNHNGMCTSVSSLPKAAIYAKIVKTPKLTNTDLNNFECHRLSSIVNPAPIQFLRQVKNDDTKPSNVTDRQHNRRKSNRLSSFFQTDV